VKFVSATSAGKILEDYRTAMAVLALVLAVLAAYWRVGDFDFLHFDDESYVTYNAVVQKGLTREGISWALTTFHATNWHPLTWFSHMADVEMFGMNAGWHHRVSVLLHAVNSVLLFLVLKGMTGAYRRSVFVAMLFAVHPLHVESVAWVAERKDVLSGLFFLLTLRAYLSYARRPDAARYLAVCALSALGLMSKPMLVTLPFVLLLLDYWPLGRIAWGGAGALRDRESISPVSLGRLLLEKAPLLAFSAASSVLTYAAQKSGQAMMPMEALSIGARVGNALLSYVKYLGKTVWPASLSVVYPHPAYLRGITGLEIALTVAFLVSVTGWVVWQARRRPYLAVGWFWYLGTLVPVIGLVQVGTQAMADRYMYLPQIGICIFVVWGIQEILPRVPSRNGLLAAAGCAVLAVLCWISSVQVTYWRNSIALFTHVVEVNPDSESGRKNLGIAHYNAGMDSLSQGKTERAIVHFREALKWAPLEIDILLNLGVAEATAGNLEEAIRLFRKAIDIDPNDTAARHNLDLALGLKKRPGPPAE
jgi:tetratricopeptide (TPR) repeat protein